MPFDVVEIQPTPNPNAAKFVLAGSISDVPMSFFTAASAKDHPVASKLFEIPGVAGVLLLGDFVTINKEPQTRWERIHNKVREILKNC